MLNIIVQSFRILNGLNLNIKTRMQIFGNAFSRSEIGNNWSNNEWFWQIGMRTTLNNFYYEQ